MNEAMELRKRLRDACCPIHAMGSHRLFLLHIDRVARVVESARNSTAAAPVLTGASAAATGGEV